MNPDYSLADWVSYRGTLTQALLSTYARHTFRVLGQAFWFIVHLEFFGPPFTR